ncbi:fimbrial protein [Tatumella terrea]|uniref:Fimbrial protein n=1 Tax=Tatumella terrea TaxID=419007 RepID=A0ABW1VVA3_9GAMM
MLKYSRHLFGVFLCLFSVSALAFTCKDSRGNTINSGGGNKSLSVYANLTPTLQAGQVMVVDLSQSISCKNDSPNSRNDNVSLLSGTAFNGALENFDGTLTYYDTNYPMPTTTETKQVNNTSGSYTPWDVDLALTPVSAASGVVINQGTLIASLLMRQVGSNKSNGGDIRTATFTWNIYANNTVFIPTGGCDVSARNVTVNLPDYPGTADVPLTIHCAENQSLAYYISGTTENSEQNIFSNTASSNSATGLGIQLSNSSGIIAANNISLGTVGTTPVSLGLSASYARTSGQVIAGKVQSIMSLTFIYQ